MREPAAHGIATMLKLFFDGDDESCKISQNLVEDVVIPKLLAVTTDQGEEEERVLHRQKLLEGYCAEQIRTRIPIKCFMSEDLLLYAFSNTLHDDMILALSDFTQQRMRKWN
jgi:hypothetical protein